jgi:hypothetical protein
MRHQISEDIRVERANTTNAIYVNPAGSAFLELHPRSARLEAVLTLSELLPDGFGRIGHRMTVCLCCGWHTPKTLLLGTVGAARMEQVIHRRLSCEMTS